jgi:hypothetical protein
MQEPPHPGLLAMIDRFALLIGAMKAGTTALYRYLIQHPQIAAPRVKEPNVLSDPTKWRQGLEEYSKMWDWRPGEHRIALDASTGYTKLPVRLNAAVAAHVLPAEFRFLYMVRNPIARLRSQYLHSLAEGWIEKPIHAGLSPDVVMFSNYQFQLQPYVAIHGRETIEVISYEAFAADARPTLRSICEFLAIDGGVAFGDPGPQNSSERYRAKLLARLIDREQVLAEPLDLEAFTGKAWGRVRAHVKRLLAVHGATDLLDACEAEIERSITPSDAQVDHLHSLLDRDLRIFAEEWGVDPWGGESARTRPNRAA